ncbi:MAG: hypothetical protein R6V27_06940 [Balneolaceae bacterium]
MNNKYVNRAKISEAKFRELIRFFSLDLTAIQIAELTGLNRNTINRYLSEIRRKISHYSQITAPPSLKIQKNLKTDKNDTFSILIKESDSKIFAETISNKQLNKETIPTLKATGFDVLINLENHTHTFIGTKSSDKAEHRKKVNRIESFWGHAKSRLAKFKGIHSSTFNLHMKECVFRFNHRGDDLYLLLLKILRNDPLF